MEFEPTEPLLDEVHEFRIDSSARDPLELVLTEFMEEIRTGGTPSIEDYARRFPDLAEQICELFPLVGNLEQWKTDKEIECLRYNVPKQFPFDQLGEYKLVRELGRGGMGVIFEGIHPTFHRSVAVKILPWRFAADMPVWRNRLQREAATIAALQHPNIVQIYTFSEDQGYYYYVMQLVEGVGLDRIIQQLKQRRSKRRQSKRSHSLPTDNEVSLTYDSWKGFAKIGEQVALALECAHEREVLHNDIKPSNLLLRADGHIIVTDFGIGQFARNESTEGDDHAIGTLQYMSPERLTGSVDPRSDIYSLGVTLYELVTQSPVFELTKPSRLKAAILQQQPTNPRRLIPDLPAPLERIILKAMAKDPTRRYASARAMAEDLRRFINRQPIHAEHGLLQRAIAWCHGWTRTWTREAQ